MIESEQNHSPRRNVRSSRAKVSDLRPAFAQARQSKTVKQVKEQADTSAVKDVFGQNQKEKNKNLFGSPPRVNTFAAVAENPALQQSNKTNNAGALSRQLMGLNVSMQDAMKKASERAEEGRKTKRTAEIAARRGLTTGSTGAAS